MSIKRFKKKQDIKVGIHSGKFSADKNGTENVRSILVKCAISTTLQSERNKTVI